MTRLGEDGQLSGWRNRAENLEAKLAEAEKERDHLLGELGMAKDEREAWKDTVKLAHNRAAKYERAIRETVDDAVSLKAETGRDVYELSGGAWESLRSSLPRDID